MLKPIEAVLLKKTAPAREAMSAPRLSFWEEPLVTREVCRENLSGF
jgi:hypothetical protein